jgi:hypothetical protein
LFQQFYRSRAHFLSGLVAYVTSRLIQYSFYLNIE